MADAALTDAQRDGIFQRLGLIAGMDWQLGRLQKLTAPKSDQVITYYRDGDESEAVLTNWDFDVDLVIRTDTDVNGFIWGTFTDGTGGTGHSIDLYNDAARTTKVGATATVDDGQTATIVAESGFNLSGTAAVGTAAGNFNFVLVVMKAYKKRVLDEFPGTDGDFDADREIGNALEDAIDSLHAQLTAARGLFHGVAERFLTEIVDPLIVSGTAEVTLNDKLEQKSLGNVVSSPEGRLEDLRRAMLDNTAGSGVIKVGPPTVGTANSFTGWSGGRLNGSITTTDRALPATIQFTCVQGLETSRAPRFRAVATYTDPRRGRRTAQFELVVNQLWEDPTLGLSLTVEYAPTIANETGVSMDTTSADWSVTGLKGSNSDSGKLWGVIHTDGTTARFYDSEANRDTNDGSTGLVTQATGLATSTAFTSTDTGTGLVVTGKTGGTINSGDTFNVDFNVPQASVPADYFTVTISHTANPSVWQALTRDGLFGLANRYRLNSAATPNVVDGWIRGGMFGNGTYYGDPE